MDLNIQSKEDNKLLNRKEIRFTVGQEGSTPSKAELVKEICKRLNLKPDSTLIVRVDQGFGRKESSGIAHSYESREAMERSEPKHILGRSAKGAAKEEQQAPEQKQE